RNIREALGRSINHRVNPARIAVANVIIDVVRRSTSLTVVVSVMVTVTLPLSTTSSLTVLVSATM
ncbi:MAG: hypothetical protein ACO2OZ_02220, partial [Acidilobaceae archaeon]